MDFKEYLMSLGVSDDKAKEITEGMPAQKFYLSSEEHLDSRYTKLKEQKELLENDLKSANELVDDLKKTNKDAEGLQQKITEYEKQVEDLKAERLETQKMYSIKEALQKEGVKDVDYMMFKLGELEVDAEGNVKDLSNKVKELKESNPTFFGAQLNSDDQKKDNIGGYQVVDNKLDNGKTSTLTKEDILKIKDSKERQEKIKENINLFG